MQNNNQKVKSQIESNKKCSFETNGSLLRFFFAGVILGLLVFISFTDVHGAEDWRQFVKGLSDKGQYDTLIDYLKSSYEKSDCPESLKKEYYYQLGKAQFGFLPNLQNKELKNGITSCKESFSNFIKEQSEHDFVLEASFEMARLLVYESKLIIHEALSLKTETEKQSYRQQARPLLDEADHYLNRTLSLGADRIKNLQNQKANNKQKSDLSQAQGLYLSARIMRANLPAEQAETWPLNSPEGKKLLEQAKAGLQEVSNKYQQFTGAYSAKYQLALVSEKLGEFENVKKILSDLAILPLEPDFYQVKTDILKLSFEFWRKHPSQEGFEGQVREILQILKEFDAWKNKVGMPDSIYQSIAGQQIHLDAARALMKIMELRKEKGPELQKLLKEENNQESKMSKAILLSSQTAEQVLQYLDFVSRLASPLSLEAEDLMKSPLLANASKKSFGKASSGAADLVSNAKKGWMAYTRAYQKNQEQGTAASQEELTQAIKDAEEKIRNCLDNAADQMESSDLYTIRLYLATIQYLTEQYIDAVKTADKLCRQEDFQEAPKAAEIALYSLKKLYSENRDATEEREKKKLAAIEKKMTDLTDFVVTRWGKEEGGAGAAVAREAMLQKIDLAIEKNDLEEAKKILEEISETSGLRVKAELRYGQALWSDYVQKINAEGDRKKSKKELDPLLEEARKSISSGLTKLVAASAARSNDYQAIYAALTLAQISLTVSDSENAMKWLTHPAIGPYHLVEFQINNKAKSKEEPSEEGAGQITPLEDKNFQLNALLLMVRVHLVTGKLAEAEKTLDLVEKLGDKDNSEKLTAIYIQLGRQLEEQLRQISNEADSGNPTSKQEWEELTKGFERLLDRISLKEKGNTYSSLRWVTETYMSMARGMGGALTNSSSKAIDYYVRAGRALQMMLKKIKADPAWAGDPKAELFVSVRLAECLCSTGRYDKALMILEPVIVANQNNLELQEEAARIYQSWGRQDREYFIKAILGGLPNQKGKNQIWGWNMIINRLNRVIDKDPRFKESFYNAWLNKFFCRYQYLRGITDDIQRQKQAADAEREMVRLKQVHPDLGGAAFRQKFDDHLRRFQKEIKPENAK